MYNILYRLIFIASTLLTSLLTYSLQASNINNTTLVDTSENYFLMVSKKLKNKVKEVSNATDYLGKEYANQYILTSNSNMKKFKTRYKKGIFEILRFSETLSYREPVVSIYVLDNKPISKQQWVEINTLAQLSHIMHSIFLNIKCDGWVYITLEDNVMGNYPYVSFAEMVNNRNPTKTIFYNAANFQDKSVGWSLPYNDLVGDGFMVTASYPINIESKLVGVASIDLTISSLIFNLKPIEEENNDHHGYMFLFSKYGKIIGQINKITNPVSQVPNYHDTIKFIQKNKKKLLSLDDNFSRIRICDMGYNYNVYNDTIVPGSVSLLYVIKNKGC